MDVNEKEHKFSPVMRLMQSTISLGRPVPFLLLTKQDRQSTCKVNLRRVRVTIVAIENQ
jgi:hypothetical protein